MKRKLWQRRLLCCFLAVAVLLGGLLCCLPVRAGAIVPLGFVQSALASYVSSTGYKLYNDNGTGQDILGSLGELYDDYVTIANKTITGQLANLAFLANSPYIYQDNSGQIVVSKVAADIFQDFADWIQTEYSVPVGSDSPTSVLSASPGGYFNANGSWIVLQPGVTYSYSANPVSNENFASICFTVTSSSSPVLFWHAVSTSIPASSGQICLQSLDSFTYTYESVTLSGSSTVRSYTSSYFSSRNCYYSSRQAFNDFPAAPVFSLVAPCLWSDFDDAVESGGVAGLGVTLAQAVADVVGQAKGDDAVVIGVGASAGATAQDIADMVAQGVKAQTLDPSVSITAEAVIDTPVQPYPDIDGLGLPTLGAALVSRFPFCVPWDFVDTLKILNADPIPPVFDVTLVPASVAARWGVSGNYTIHVDLTSQEYAKLFVALRWGTLVGFCLGLALLTKRLIWTA